MVRVPISVQPRPYEAVIERGLLSRAGESLRQLFPDRKRCFIITVPAVRKRWAKKLLASLSETGWDPKVLEMGDGERYKTLSTVEQLAEKLSAAGADRQAVVLAFGGGVVGDVAGLLASLYMRGVEVVQVPTTVLAQVDASIGGKTGVDLKAGKNLVGTFHQPRAVLIDPDVLSTLSDREFRSGLYEIVKAGVIGRPQLFERFERERHAILQREPDVVECLIAESVKLKAEVVSADEKEAGLRQVLNFGHTIGHAIERVADFEVRHGDCVSLGMVAACHVSMKHAGLSAVERDQVVELLQKFDLPTQLPRQIPRRQILETIRRDKKFERGEIRFVVASRLGRARVSREVTMEDLGEAIGQL